PMAARPARAHSTSCASVPPLAPTPPSNSPPILSGNPPPASSSGRPVRPAMLVNTCGRDRTSATSSPERRPQGAAEHPLLFAAPLHTRQRRRVARPIDRGQAHRRPRLLTFGPCRRHKPFCEL